MSDLVREGHRWADEWHGWYAGGTERMPSRPGCERIEQALRDLADALEAAEREIHHRCEELGLQMQALKQLEERLEAAEKVCEAAKAYRKAYLEYRSSTEEARLDEALDAWEKTR